MMFCRFCGKEIHESAPACPQCGGIQHPAATTAARGAEPGIWVPVLALISSIIGALALLDDRPAGTDTLVGIITFASMGLVFGFVSICNQVTGRKMAIAAVLLSLIATLAALGQLIG